MITFDLAEVRDFAGGLELRMNRCDNGEGMECANLDDTLRNYAHVCFDFWREVQQWARAVFAGQVAFDPKVEEMWRDKGRQLYQRAGGLWTYGQEREGECFVLEAGASLGSALWRLELLLSNWVTPKPAIAPLARQGIPLASAAKEEIRARIEKLPPLPSHWEPTDPVQQTWFKKLRQRQSS